MRGRLDAAAALLADWDRRATRLATPCGGGCMVWRVWGSGPALVLVHGGAGAWSHWVRNLEPLVAGRTVIAPDLPGLGDSGTPPRPYSPESIAHITAEGLAAVLPQIGADGGLDVCGFSFGGMIAGLVAERLAGTHAVAVRRLVLIGASGLGGRFDELTPVRKLREGASEAERLEVHRHNLAAMMIHEPSRIDELALCIQSVNAPRTRVMSPEHALSDKLARSLRRSRLDFHSLWGACCIFRPDLERRRRLLASIRPAAEFRIVPGAGHWVQYEAAERTNAELDRLLAPS